MPSLAVANDQHAWNHTVNGVRVRSKIVPAVTDVRCEHAAHSHRPSASRHPSTCPYSSQTNPSGDGSHASESRQSASVPNHDMNSPTDRGYSCPPRSATTVQSLLRLSGEPYERIHRNGDPGGALVGDRRRRRRRPPVTPQWQLPMTS